MTLSDGLESSGKYRKPIWIEARRTITRPLRRMMRKFGFDIVFAPEYGHPPDLGEEGIALVREVQPFTKTVPEKIYALVDAIGYITRYGIEGDIVECGVWKGGSMMAAAKALLRSNDTRRRLYLFDTFSGMPRPTEKDIDYANVPADARLEKEPGIQAFAPLEDVQKAMTSTGYPVDKICYVKGRVEETIPDQAPERIALLRLDTDWYESTQHELVHLFPRLSSGGVLIIDDYGYWKGSRLATDEYFAQQGARIFLMRVECGRIAVKQ